MNLIAYDKVKRGIDRTKTWIDIHYRVLVSNEINPRKYTTLVKKYNPIEQATDYFLVTLDDQTPENDAKPSIIDDYGRFKYRLQYIWFKSPFAQYTEDDNINIEHIEHSDDGDIYRLDFL